MNGPKISPFAAHRDMVMGYYGTASWLRLLVLSMWNGSGYQVGLSPLRSLDGEHFGAALSMIQSYREHGERDPAFMALADECRARIDEECAAAERVERLDDWNSNAQSAVRRAGGRSGYVEDHYSWFEKQFDAGLEPDAAAALALRSDLDRASAGGAP